MRETRRALEVATIELTLESGIENVTIEQIAERATVSPRTFFNYFPSKEDALLGLASERWEADLLAAFPRRPSGAGVYIDLRDFLVAHFRERLFADDLLERRIAALASSPELMKRNLNQMTVLLQKLTLLTARLLLAEGTRAHEGNGSEVGSPVEDRAVAEGPIPDEHAHPAAALPPEPTAEAHMLLLVCGSALNYAFHSWLTSGTGDQPADGIASAFARLEKTLVRQVLPVVGREASDPTP